MASPDNPTNFPERLQEPTAPAKPKIPFNTPKKWTVSGRELPDNMYKRNGYTLLPLTSEQTKRIPQALIQNVRGVPYTLASVVKQLERETRPTRSSRNAGENSAAGEPISGVIPQNFIDAFKTSKIKQGHRAPHSQLLGWWVQTIASGLRQPGQSPEEIDKKLYALDLFVLETPTQSDIEEDPSLVDKSAEVVSKYVHSRLALKDPIGYAMAIIRTDAQSQGINITIDNELTVKRLARFQKRHHTEGHSSRRPLAKPGEPQK